MMMINAYPQKEKRLERRRRVGVTPTTFFEVLRIRDFSILLVKKWYIWVISGFIFATLIAQTALIPGPYSATGTIRITSSLPSSEFYSERVSVETEIDLLRSYKLIDQTLTRMGHDATIFPIRNKLAQLASIEPTGLVRKFTKAIPIPLVDNLAVTKTSVDRKILRGYSYRLTFNNDKVEVYNNYDELIDTALIGEPLNLDIGQVELAEINYLPKWDYHLTVYDRHNMIRFIQSILEIRPEPLKLGGGLMHLQLTHYDRRFVNEFIDELIKSYVDVSGESITKNIGTSISELKIKQKKLNENIERYSHTIEKTQSEHDVIDPKFEANKLTEQILVAKEKVQSLKTRRQKLLRDVTREHPTVLTINDKIALEQRLVNELQQKISVLPNVGRVISTNQLLLDTAEQNLATVNEKLIHLTSYLNISKNYAEKVHGATPKHKPYRSKIFRLFILSGIFGAICGMLFIIITGSDKIRKIKTLTDITTSTRLPIFCRIKQTKKTTEPPRDSNENITTWLRVAENIPYLFVGGNAKPVVLQPTNVHPTNFNYIRNVVKAFGTKNRCLIVDFDFQRRTYTEYENMKDKKGALEVLAGVASLEKCIQNLSENVDLLPAGNGLATHSIEDIIELAHALVQQASIDYDQVFVVMPADAKAARVGATFGYVVINAAIEVSKQQFTQLFKDYDPEERATAVTIID